ncbi:MAG: transglutaminase domain-containing protein [Acidobacteria bacterium]|nr:transglutaminase domain-containing protein [Acidobacteriota bacterium]
MKTSRILLFLLLVVISAGSVGAEEVAVSTAASTRVDEEKDLWYVVELLGQRAGYFHVESRWVPFEGKEALRVQEVLRNQMTRSNGGVTESVQVLSTTTRYEASSGGTLQIENLLDQGGGPTRSTVEVTGEVARVTVEGAAGDRSFEMPWDESVMGPRAAEDAIDSLISGTSPFISYKVFSFEAGNQVLDMRAKVLERKEDGTVLLEQEFVGLGVVAHETYEADGTLLRQEVGPVVLRLAGREEALAPVEQSLAVFEKITVFLDRSVLRTAPRGAYRLLPREGWEGLSLSRLFVEDGRQHFLRDEAGEVLVVERVKDPLPEPSASFDPESFLRPSSLIESDDPEIRRLARSLATDSRSSVDLARRLERWVHDNIGFTGAGIGLATARQTLDSKDGDCTENAFLLAALLRAVEIPSRIVVGLVGAGEQAGRTRFVPHAWVEAYAEGWLPLDAAVYAPEVDVTHLAMAKSDGGEEGALLEVTVPLLEGLGRFDLAWAEPTR